tara:strand:+ start:1597 stop:1788 length:192 start_codon:yes stop_codon:yes gene_type:complete
MGYGKIYETTYFGEVKENGYGKIYFKKAEVSFEYIKEQQKRAKEKKEPKDEKPKKDDKIKNKK